MANLIHWIEELAAGESIEAVVIGEMGWGDFGGEAVPQYAEQKRGVILTWADAKPMLDYDFYSGYGAPGCNAIYAWTPTKVIFVWQYDGATGMKTIPCNPVDCMPDMPGG